jgi:Uma2 family endonuclease
MVMVTTTRPWTRADMERLPDDGNRYEVLDGKLLVTPLPSIPHQGVATRIAGRLMLYCDAHGIGFVAAPGGILHGESELQPDVAVYLGRRMRDESDWAKLPAPALVVEILSPSTRHRDVGVKRAAYLHWGVPEYWIIDPDERVVIIVRPGLDDERVVDTLRWRSRPELPALEIGLDEVFR